MLDSPRFGSRDPIRSGRGIAFASCGGYVGVVQSIGQGYIGGYQLLDHNLKYR